MELRSSGGALLVGRYGGMEVWSSGGAPQACRRVSYEALELWRRCRRSVVEARSSEVLEL